MSDGRGSRESRLRGLAVVRRTFAAAASTGSAREWRTYASAVRVAHEAGKAAPVAVARHTLQITVEIRLASSERRERDERYASQLATEGLA
jgi:hypothetical protein